MSVIPRQTESTGIMSRRLRSFEGNWRKLVPRRYDNDAEVLMPSFHPIKESATDVSTIAGRTMATGRPFARLPIKDSARLLVSVYVFGQPSSAARRDPASVR